MVLQIAKCWLKQSKIENSVQAIIISIENEKYISRFVPAIIQVCNMPQWIRPPKNANYRGVH